VASLFANGQIVVGIVMLMILELIVLIMVRKKSQPALSTAALITNLAAGAALLLSLRAALVDSRWQTVAVWLAVAFVAHVCDLKLRWSTR
jgi:hypothetical protein